MKFLLDENFPKLAITHLREKGYDVYDIKDLIGRGASDQQVAEIAQLHHATILSTDRDFFHTLSHQTTQHFGMIVIALKQPNAAKILARLDWLIDQFSEEEIVNRAFQLRDKHWICHPVL